MKLSCIEICAGAGGQSIGLEQAGFEPEALIEIDASCCNTLRKNRPNWNIIEDDLRNFNGTRYKGIDLLAGGVPCPHFSKAGKHLGNSDDRDMFPEALRLVSEIQPKAVMFENVRGFLDSVFEDYRLDIKYQLQKSDYQVEWRLLNASDYGVSQLRPRVVIVGFRNADTKYAWPSPYERNPQTVGELLFDIIEVNGWVGASGWKEKANDIAPTIVGGSKKHGGPDLGPTRAKKAWAMLNVDGKGIADEAHAHDFIGMPRLTVPMVARIQGFPDSWTFTGRKTPAYRQVGNAFPPPVAIQLHAAITKKKILSLVG